MILECIFATHDNAVNWLSVNPFSKFITNAIESVRIFLHIQNIGNAIFRFDSSKMIKKNDFVCKLQFSLTNLVVVVVDCFDF